MLTVPHFMATNSGAYKLAVATAHQSPQFMEALGAPVAEAWFSEGKEEWGNPAKATLMVPVQGQKRQGNLRAVAVKVDGEWRLKELTLELSQPEEHIDLLGAASPAVQFVRCMTVVTSPLHSLTRGRPILWIGLTYLVQNCLVARIGAKLGKLWNTLQELRRYSSRDGFIDP
jgi:hypothetical protein